MKYVKGNANEGYRVAHSGKKKAHNPKREVPIMDVIVRKMTEEDWARFKENSSKKK